MDKKIKAIWLKALRSGKYRRTTGTLRTVSKAGTERFCCLGVLADVASPEPWVGRGGGYTFFGNGKSTGLLGSDFQRRCGLTDDQQDFLSNMNDGGWTFKRLANWIEKNL